MFTDIDDCKSKPCQNEGDCYDGINDYVCRCKQGYKGKNCQKSKHFICFLNPVHMDMICICANFAFTQILHTGAKVFLTLR